MAVEKPGLSPGFSFMAGILGYGDLSGKFFKALAPAIVWILFQVGVEVGVSSHLSHGLGDG